MCLLLSLMFRFFFFNETATTEIYTLSLHDALPIWALTGGATPGEGWWRWLVGRIAPRDRKSTRLNSSHMSISYAVFCLKKKKQKAIPITGALDMTDRAFPNDANPSPRRLELFNAQR